MTIEVSREESYALKKFRTSSYADLVKTVLLRELGFSRERYESLEADESTRQEIVVYKRVLDVLFSENMVKEKADEV